MINPEKKEQFIVMKAKGFSYDKIALEIEVSKPTLINWGNELKEEIAKAKGIEKEAIIEGFKLSKEKRLQGLGENFVAINEELKVRNLKDVSTLKLFELSLKCQIVIKEELKELEQTQKVKEEALDLKAIAIDFERNIGLI